MTDSPVLPPLPKAEHLEAMGRKARKKKVPHLPADLHGQLPGIGEFKIVDAGGTIHLEWQIQDGPRKRFGFDELSRDVGLASERLEVGWLIADLWLAHGHRIRNSIPSPNEAMRESARFFDAEDRWRHWAQVPAGHMIF